ncbi:AMP-binding protein [Nostoc sp.]|uniref:AMP-binding protein n=1 Tax=Nostoc sp. TaxID=1180 RepID=UPI003FA605DA
MLLLYLTRLGTLYDLSSLKIITSAAAPLDNELTLECEQRLNCVVKQAYGLTETSPMTHINLTNVKK